MREDPTDGAAPVMCDEHRPVELERFDQSFHVVR